MSTLIAQQVAADAPERVASLVLVTPVAPVGLRATEETVGFLERMATDEAVRREVFTARGYVRMFAATGVTGCPRADIPVIAVLGEHDHEPFREATVRAGLSGNFSRLEVATCANAGHYPMQETPVALATVVERFLRARG